ncbi:MAG TPA: PAS domain S-box protein, partial [Acidimicrobiia bacterium]
MVKELIEGRSAIVCDVASGLEDGYDAVLAGEHDAYLVALTPGSESELGRIRELADEAPGPLVVLTQTVEDDADVYALNVGAEYLVKDRLSPELVESRLRHSVERWRVRRKAEEGFLRYRSLFDGVPVGLFRVGPDGTFIEVNATAVRALGYEDQSQIVGRNVAELLAEDQSLEAPIFSGASEGELHAETRDGDTLWVSVTLEEVRNEAGDVTHFEGMALDITEQKETKRELRRYRELTSAAYDESSVAKAIVSLPEGRIISANEAIGVFLGYDRDSLAGMHFADVTHPDDVGADSLQFKRLVDSEIDSYEIDKRYVRSDGAVVWGRLQVSMIHGDGGTGYVLGEIVDITETKEAQGDLAFQASLFEQMRTPVIATDRRGCVTHWNQQAKAAYGWTAGEAMGRDFVDLVLPALDTSQLETMRADFRQEGLWEGELSITRKGGSMFPAWASGAVVRDARGRAAGIVGAIVDLSDVQKARAEALTHEMLSRSLLEAVSIPIAILDSAGDIVASNPSWALSGGARVHPYVPCFEEEAPAPEVVGQIESGVE